MKRTRIEIATIPQELPPPHFDDEATIVSARQVVPIAHAKVVQRSRALLSMIPILLTAAVFGALGALAVNYYQGRPNNLPNSAPRVEINQLASQAPGLQTPNAAPNISGSESASGALAPSESPTPLPDGSPETKTAKSVAPPPADSNDSAKQDESTDFFAKTNNANEPGKLVRKRRVMTQPPTDGKTENPPKDKRGAGKIQELFSGPNPQ